MSRTTLIFIGLAIGIDAVSCGDSDEDGGKGGASGGNSGNGGSLQTGGGSGQVICTELGGPVGGCGTTYESCSDGNTYAVDCATQCTCSVNGTVTSTFDASTFCNPSSSQCGWDLIQGCLTDSGKRVPQGKECAPGVNCCNANGYVTCSSFCGDGGSPGSGGSAGSDGG